MKNTTKTGQIPTNVGHSMTPTNVVTPMTKAQKAEQSRNIRAWQAGSAKAYSN